MSFDFNRSMEILERTPAALSAWLGGLSDFWTRSNYGEATFCPFDVIGHLIHAERANWMPRLQVIVEHGEAKPFEPFDRYAMFEASKGKAMAELLETFVSLRARNLRDLRALGLTPEMLDRRGMHPELGGVTLRQLIASWVVHDLGHMHQIAKAMAYQYRDEVGGWKKVLTILPRHE